MKAAVYDGKKVSLQELPMPEINKTEVLIKVKAAGICGTDLAIAKGHLKTPTPLILGHEIVGEVVKIGKEVNPKWINKRVTCEINTNIDFDCYFCQRQIYTQCTSRKALGIDVDGGFAEYIAVESYLLHEIPDSISYREATFIEPLAAAYQTFELMPLEKDDKIAAIFGLGKLGLLLTQVAHLKGLKIIAVDGSEKKLALARNFGAEYTINRIKTEYIPKRIKDFTKGIGADIIIDTSGNPDTLNDIINSCRTRGKIHIKSTHGIPTSINLTDMVVREISLYTSRCGPFEKAIEGLKKNKISVKKLLTAEYHLSEIDKALKTYDDNRDNIKTVLIIDTII
ncbi:MAG: alcohol dehydrogenase catalytic domain-containing protein [Candidatus Lokiarchaeota archaeon]|nr:alcohol dehydrogenase catalytic domain-containing protein [Candidatus Lokiarchaeota archaeon]MBD3339448.1 alcohol dehydrogenase catalytic domain-containing protein [Candidatus Lokiarchaeota archaeon]